MSPSVAKCVQQISNNWRLGLFNRDRLHASCACFSKMLAAGTAANATGIPVVLDPVGVGARDLRECLLLQLRELPGDHDMARRLLLDHYDELIAHRWIEIARRTGTTASEVQDAADQIAKLNPKPGFSKSASPDGYVVPDLSVEKVDGQYLVFLNDTNIPRLRLSRVYQEMARDRKKFTAEHKEFVASKLNAAQWLIQAIEQRRQHFRDPAALDLQLRRRPVAARHLAETLQVRRRVVAVELQPHQLDEAELFGDAFESAVVNEPAMGDVTLLLNHWRDGDRDAADVGRIEHSDQLHGVMHGRSIRDRRLTTRDRRTPREARCSGYANGKRSPTSRPAPWPLHPAKALSRMPLAA